MPETKNVCLDLDGTEYFEMQPSDGTALKELTRESGFHTMRITLAFTVTIYSGSLMTPKHTTAPIKRIYDMRSGLMITIIVQRNR